MSDNPNLLTMVLCVLALVALVIAFALVGY